MILIAPKPNAEYRGDFRIYRSDHRQIILDVDPPDVLPLANAYGCSPTPKAIVAHAFPDGLSVHCFGCGAFIEKPEDRERWYWFASGDIIDFLYYHRAHVDWVWQRPRGENEALEAAALAGQDAPPALVNSLPAPPPGGPERPALADGFVLILPGIHSD